MFRVDFDNLEYLEVIERKHDMVSENSALFKVMPDVMLNVKLKFAKNIWSLD